VSRRPWTIRTRLVVTLATVAAAVIIISGVATVLTVQHQLEQRVGERLLGNTERIQATLMGIPGLDLTTQTLTEMAKADSTAVLVEIGGQAVLTANTDPATVKAILQLDLGDGQPEPVPGHPGVMAIEIDTRGSSLVINDGGRQLHPDGIIIAVDATDEFAAFQNLVFASTAGALVSIAVLVLLTVFIVGHGIRPLRTMSEQAQSFADGDRATRLTVPSGDPDITRLATTVNQAFDAQQEADDRLRAFVADASHELRTPLTTASGWIELYLQGGLSDLEHRDHAMLRVQTELGRMRVLIDELAMLARMDAARPLDVERLDLSTLTTEVVDDIRVANPDRAFTVFAAGPAPLLGDPQKLQQVLLNLIGNTVQHTAAGTPVEITVAPATEFGVGQHAYTLLVTDHGPGIAVADRPHVFERFWRSDASRDRHTGGSGLGLSIVASIVAAHGGTYGVSSRPGEGTTMRVTLPGVEPGDVDRPAAHVPGVTRAVQPTSSGRSGHSSP
jgi:two-component system, OmpR family, sensor kinase